MCSDLRLRYSKIGDPASADNLSVSLSLPRSLTLQTYVLLASVKTLLAQWFYLSFYTSWVFMTFCVNQSISKGKIFILPVNHAVYLPSASICTQGGPQTITLNPLMHIRSDLFLFVVKKRVYYPEKFAKIPPTTILFLFFPFVERKFCFPLGVYVIYGSNNFLEADSKVNHQHSYPKQHFKFKKQPNLNPKNT